MTLRLVAALTALAALGGVGAAVADQTAQHSRSKRCLGAASRDPETPCRNPALRKRVKPSPNRAQITPNLACTRTTLDETLEQCAFGTRAEDAVETVAIVGDSHAAHWRAAMSVMAKAKRWRVLEIATPHCPFSTAVPKPSGDGDEDRWCPDWNRRVIEWLGQHPEVRKVFVSANANAPIKVPADEEEYETRTRGFVEIWQQVPASVERIFVIRDNPLDRFDTHDCVRRAMRRDRDAGRVCALPRSRALRADAAVPAAARLDPPRAHVIDLTPHFCGRRRCFPVVGGVLVHKDVDHLTRAFARTLGPYLLRGVERVLATGAST